MELLATYYPLLAGMMPLAWVALATWMGVRFGARAVMMVNLPLHIIAMQALQTHKYGIEVVQSNALTTLFSLPMVFTWTLCWLVVAPWIERVFPDPPGSHRSAWLSSIGSVLLAWAVNVWVLRPMLALVPEGPTARLPVIFAFALFGSGVAIWAQREEPPERADGSLTNYVLRLMSILFLVQLGDHLATTGALPTVRSIFGSFPRLTFEMVIGVQAAHGFRAGRQVLAGLPVGLALPIGWCLIMIYLPEVASTQTTWIAAGVWFVASLVGAIGLILWMDHPAPVPDSDPALGD